ISRALVFGDGLGPDRKPWRRNPGSNQKVIETKSQERTFAMFNNLLGMNPVIIFVLIALVWFSLASWTVMIAKLLQIRTWTKKNGEFMEVFESIPHPLRWEGDWDSFATAPLGSLFLKGRDSTRPGGT